MAVKAGFLNCLLLQWRKTGVKRQNRVMIPMDAMAVDDPAASNQLLSLIAYILIIIDSDNSRKISSVVRMMKFQKIARQTFCRQFLTDYTLKKKRRKIMTITATPMAEDSMRRLSVLLRMTLALS